MNTKYAGQHFHKQKKKPTDANKESPLGEPLHGTLKDTTEYWVMPTAKLFYCISVMPFSNFDDVKTIFLRSTQEFNWGSILHVANKKRISSSDGTLHDGDDETSDSTMRNLQNQVVNNKEFRFILRLIR